jgi:hypothetical protein
VTFGAFLRFSVHTPSCGTSKAVPSLADSPPLRYRDTDEAVVACPRILASIGMALPVERCAFARTDRDEVSERFRITDRSRRTADIVETPLGKKRISRLVSYKIYTPALFKMWTGIGGPSRPTLRGEDSVVARRVSVPTEG